MLMIHDQGVKVQVWDFDNKQFDFSILCSFDNNWY